MSNFIINLDYLRSWNAIFKILQLALGTICVGIIGHEFNNTLMYSSSSASFFLISTTTFYIGTFILFISYLLSPSAASIIPKTIYELVYHAIASLFLFSGSVAMMVYIHKFEVKGSYYKAELAASICCLLNTCLYICSAVMGFSTYGDD
ncbi:uncharacterized protein LOC105840786 [Monomorium pharaonis]|uniref:uncharacterized protein LOC105840786 n=1 Tax=Monomorium pharaonis TaxID=307658 RepID=UPI00063F249A|nr:uncharacterized protein LOC105840786 [Monomorium pharaonis]